MDKHRQYNAGLANGSTGLFNGGFDSLSNPYNQYHSPHFNAGSNNFSITNFTHQHSSCQSNATFTNKNQAGMFEGGVEFDKIFQKDYFDDVINPPDSSTGGITSLRSSPQKTKNKIIKDSEKQKLKKSIKEDESILESMNQLLHAVNQLKMSSNQNIVDNKMENNEVGTRETANKNKMQVNQGKKKQQEERTIKQGAEQGNPLSKYINQAFKQVKDSKATKPNNTASYVDDASSASRGQQNQQSQTLSQLHVSSSSQYRSQNQPNILQNTSPTSATSRKSPQRIGLQNQIKVQKPGTRTPSPLTSIKFSNLHSKTPSMLTKQAEQQHHANNTSAISSQKELSQEVINRLFLNHKKSQDLIEKKRFVQHQRDMEVLQDKPSISQKSQKLVLNSVRAHQPIYSPKRYQHELQSLRLKKEQAQKQKELEDREKEIAEEQEMMIHNIHNNDRKLNITDFNRKYENQVKQWEARKNGMYQYLTQQQLGDNEQLAFKPEINKKSKQIAQDVQRIEKRVSMLVEDKRKKIETLTLQTQPNFTPKINKNTEKFLSGADTTRYNNHHSKSPMKDPRSLQKPNISASNRSQSPLSSTIIQTKKPQLKEFQKLKLSTQGRQLSKNKSSSGLIEKSPGLEKNKSHGDKPQKIISTLQSQEWLPGQTESLRQSSNIKNYRQKIEHSNHNLQNLLQSMSKPIEGEQLDILKEYMKLKDQFNESLSNRNSMSNLNAFQQPPPQQQQQNQFSKTQALKNFQPIKQSQKNFTKSSLSPIKKKHNFKPSQNEELISMSSPSKFNFIADQIQVKDFEAVLQQDMDQSENKGKLIRIEAFQSKDDQSQCFDINSDSNHPNGLKNLYNSESFMLANQTISSSHHTNQKNNQIIKLKELKPKSINFINQDQIVVGGGYRSSKDSNQMELILNNIKDSIDLMSSRIRNLQDEQVETNRKQQASSELQKEITKLRSLKPFVKSIDIGLDKTHNQKMKGLRDSWEAAINEIDIQTKLKQDQTYQRIMLSKSQDTLISEEMQITEKIPNKFNIVKESQQTHKRRVTSSKPFSRSYQALVQEPQSLTSVDKTKQDINNTQQSNYKVNIDYNFKSESSPTKILEEESEEVYHVNEDDDNYHNNLNNLPDLTFNEISRYLDKEAQIYLKSSKLISKQQSKKSLLNESIRQEEIIRKLVETNSRKFSNNNAQFNSSVLSIPKEVLNEIEEYGLDSITILQSVIHQFSHLFKSPERRKQDLLKIKQRKKQQSNVKRNKRLEEANVFTLNKNI